jgi:hypothetical protein
MTLQEAVHQGYAWCADEITRLRAELAEAMDSAARAHEDWYEVADALRAERDALREALKPFADLHANRFMTDGLRYEFRVDVAWIRKARAALNPSPEAAKEE